MNIPNSITLFRMMLVPLIVWLILREQMLAAFIVFLIAGVTDALDGLIAKQFDLVTPLGTYLDPLADKVLLVSIYVTLGIQEFLPSWLVILVVSRDILIVGGILLTFLMELNLEIAPSKISKFNTFFQISLAALILGDRGLNIDDNFFIVMCIYAVAVTTVLSGHNYILQWSRQNS
ncbi:CDP-alcohol phosphatidyltransferase family protein [Sneathiella marina]|uniref:CDP-diacylglycerol--glycerol-3-phosphate 3-phosphatidyltransferase n=1 Tax=Sneathiella marina TaxID=2950108 RepID=A0ABY4W043_9PROT|nr:CDP-alcohol phosphatidyltransferase family protein [Sneathiella marina]USG59468.1 CDP-alcohol phosphatidyltransferase family protein [Sneathiella marina]